jgi:hypothetical protein
VLGGSDEFADAEPPQRRQKRRKTFFPATMIRQSFYSLLIAFPDQDSLIFSPALTLPPLTLR